MIKLVRDTLSRKIPAAALRTAEDGREIMTLLAGKVAEEAGEIAASDFDDINEFADCLEAFQALVTRSHFSWAQIEAARIEKRQRLGGFDQALVYDPALDPTRA